MTATIRQITQISEHHCGPAVIEMLLDAQGVQVSQAAITRAAGVTATIQTHGSRVDQLAKAVSQVAPHLLFWYKYRASIDDIKQVLNRGYGVAVEWQGIFYETLEEQLRHGDQDAGHYSIVSHYDDQTDQLVIVDPYLDFVDRDRIISAADFLERWWDDNEVTDEDTGRSRFQRDEQLLFFVTPETENFAVEDGFKQYVSLDE